MKAVLCLVLFVAVVTAKEDGVKTILKVYEECSNADSIMSCLKKKAIIFFDRAARMESIPLVDGLDIVKSSSFEPQGENDIEANLARAADARDETLTSMLWDRIAAFANSRTIQLSLPKVTGQQINEGVVEGRGKMKKMMSMMMMGGAMKMAAMIPLAIAGLFVLAGKALIVSKIALLLAGIIALKKIIAAKNSGSSGGHESHGWSSGGGSGGWDRRAFASDLAYAGQKA